MAEAPSLSRENSDGCESVDQNMEAGENESVQQRDTLECAVCLQPCIHPVQLPCGHIFCFLCVKGVANQSKRCAMCRQEIPADYLDHPHLVRGEEELTESAALEDGNQWFYEGRNGWWQYDERTSSELETAFKKGEKTCELLIAGFLYVVDFENMLQMRRNDPSRRRRIKRDLASIPKKGVAGLRLQIPTSISQSAISDSNRDFADGEEHENELALGNITVATGAAVSASSACGFNMPLTNRVTARREIVKSPSPVPGPPNNTPQTPHTPSTNSGDTSPDITASDLSLSLAIEGIENLRLRDNLHNSDEIELYYDLDQSDLAHDNSWTVNTLVSSDEDNV